MMSTRRTTSVAPTASIVAPKRYLWCWLVGPVGLPRHLRGRFPGDGTLRLAEAVVSSDSTVCVAAEWELDGHSVGGPNALFGLRMACRRDDGG